MTPEQLETLLTALLQASGEDTRAVLTVLNLVNGPDQIDAWQRDARKTCRERGEPRETTPRLLQVGAFLRDVARRQEKAAQYVQQFVEAKRNAVG